MKTLILVAAVIAAIAVTNGPAATHSPCVRHGVVAPYISMATSDGAILTGAGDIGGCPSSVQTESVSIKVCLQRDGTDVTCSQYDRAWNRYSRFARQAGGSINAPCAPGVWRTVVTGGDGFLPTIWMSDPVMFEQIDGSACRHI